MNVGCLALIWITFWVLYHAIWGGVLHHRVPEDATQIVMFIASIVLFTITFLATGMGRESE